jgi:hypothetical protein
LLTLSIVVVPAWVGLVTTPAGEALGAIAGIGLGAVLARATVIDSQPAQA